MKTLYDIQPGDQVMCKSNYTSCILKVDRVTPTLIICGTQKFRKEDGCKTPRERWHWCQIEILTDELKTEFDKRILFQKNIRLIKTTDWEHMSEEVVNQIANMIRENI